MTRIITTLIASIVLACAAATPSLAQVRVVATFSVLGDIVRQVAGDKVLLQVLVGPDGEEYPAEYAEHEEQGPRYLGRGPLTPEQARAEQAQQLVDAAQQLPDAPAQDEEPDQGDGIRIPAGAGARTRRLGGTAAETGRPEVPLV